MHFKRSFLRGLEGPHLVSSEIIRILAIDFSDRTLGNIFPLEKNIYIYLSTNL